MNYNQPYTPRLKPEVHQMTGIKLMLADRIPNFDDQGLGKTKQCYDTMARLLERREIDLVILVVKASLKDTLYSEIFRDATQLTPIIVGGAKRARFAIYNHLVGNVLILSYETATIDLEPLKRLMTQNKTGLCIDESHYLKNSNAKRTKACLELANLATRTLTFSGTPLPNKMTDLYPQLKAIGLDVGATVSDFQSRFKEPKDLRDFLRGKFIRRKKTELKALRIPPKRIRRIEVKLEKIQQQLYNSVKSDIVSDLKRLRIRKKFLPISNILSKLLRLNQVTSNPNLIFENYSEVSAKFIALDKIIAVSVNKNKKVLIWTSFRKNVEELSIRYKELNPVVLHGGLSQTEKKLNADAFMINPECKVMIAIPACAREGFTLTSCHTAVYLDRSFSYLDWAQSQDRIHRISQTKEVEILVLHAKNTIDERVDEIIQKKHELQAYVLGETEECAPQNKISIEDCLKLLT